MVKTLALTLTSNYHDTNPDKKVSVVSDVQLPIGEEVSSLMSKKPFYFLFPLE